MYPSAFSARTGYLADHGSAWTSGWAKRRLGAAGYDPGWTSRRAQISRFCAGADRRVRKTEGQVRRGHREDPPPNPGAIPDFSPERASQAGTYTALQALPRRRRPMPIVGQMQRSSRTNSGRQLSGVAPRLPPLAPRLTPLRPDADNLPAEMALLAACLLKRTQMLRLQTLR